jgi:hypothetical protein
LEPPLLQWVRRRTNNYANARNGFESWPNYRVLPKTVRPGAVKSTKKAKPNVARNVPVLTFSKSWKKVIA